jgi:hypothetical protein
MTDPIPLNSMNKPFFYRFLADYIAELHEDESKINLLIGELAD